MDTRRYVVYDDFGDLRSFYSRKEAKWFCENKPEFNIRVLDKPIETPLIDLVGECLF